MVIQCSACDTRFKIADDKVKPGGVKVRCSKCKEVFTVMPPEDEAATEAPVAEEPAAAPAADEPTASDWSDMSSTFAGEPEAPAQEETGEQASLDNVDWGSLNGSETAGDEAGEPATEEFSFGGEEEEVAAADESAEMSFSFGDSEDESAAEEPAQDEAFSFGDDAQDEQESDEAFSFGEDEAAPEAETGAADFGFDEGGDETEEAFSFGGDSESTEDPFGFEEPVGEGAQDEFSFDDAPATDSVDDFDWDGSSSESSDDSGFGFGESQQASDSLDFSSVEISEEEESPVEMEEPSPSLPETMPEMEESRPATVKGPQKSRTQKGRKGKKIRAKKKSGGPLRTIAVLFLLLILAAGGALYGIKELGFWSGKPEELASVDFKAAGEAAWQKALVMYNDMIGNEAALQAGGTITILEMTPRYVENNVAGQLFVIEGKVRNDFKVSKSGFIVRGVLLDQNNATVRQQQVYCGNPVNETMLTTASIEEIQKLGQNEIGEFASNLDVSPGTTIPYTIVFDKLPANITNYNVMVVEQAGQ